MSQVGSAPLYQQPGTAGPQRGAAFCDLAQEVRGLQHVLELRVDVDDIGVARLCAQGSLQIGDDALQRLPPEGIEQEQHGRLGAVALIHDIHAMQLECRALLGGRTVALDVLLRDAVQMR